MSSAGDHRIKAECGTGESGLAKLAEVEWAWGDLLVTTDQPIKVKEAVVVEGATRQRTMLEAAEGTTVIGVVATSVAIVVCLGAGLVEAGGVESKEAVVTAGTGAKRKGEAPNSSFLKSNIL